MVQKDSPNSSGDDHSSGTPAESEPPVNPAKGIATGKFLLVGWAVDITGPRIADEICQIAAYTPTEQFAQYIMPFTDFKPIYSRKHCIRIVNTVRYRRLKNLDTNEYVKTKSEISGLTDFLQWLEKVKGSSDGVVLVYHESRKSAPRMVLEALRRYNLSERFGNVVKGFANGFNIAQAKCANTTKSFTLKTMSNVLLNNELENFSSAVGRAKVSYEIAVHLAQGERQELVPNASGDCTGGEPHIFELVCPFANAIEVEEEEIALFKVLLERQKTFRPVFDALLKSNAERRHASHLRSILAENNIEYDSLKQAFEDGAKEGLEKLIKSEVANASEADLIELLEILDCFFDPEKKAVEPKINNNRRPRRKSMNGKKRTDSETLSPSDNPSDSTVSVPTSPDEPVTEVEAQ